MLLISGYPNSVISEPEFYISQIATIFVGYDRDLVRKAVAPSGIPYDVAGHLPTVGEVNKWLIGKKAYVDRMAAYKALPPPNYNYLGPRPAAPNLFVPEDVPGYDDVKRFIAVAKRKYWREEKDRVCWGDRVRSGYWVPESWWSVRHSLSYEQWEKRWVYNPGMRKWDFSDQRRDMRKPLTEDEKKAALESAAEAGRKIMGMKLLPETLMTINPQSDPQTDNPSDCV